MLGIATVCALTLTFIVLEFVEDKVRSKFSKKKRETEYISTLPGTWMEGFIYTLANQLEVIASFMATMRMLLL